MSLPKRLLRASTSQPLEIMEEGDKLAGLKNAGTLQEGHARAAVKETIRLVGECCCQRSESLSGTN